jgi:predicted AAA+ superfamily ATPase
MKCRKHLNFIFFDTGIVRALNKQVEYNLNPRSFEYGKLFETFVVNELNRRLCYQGKQFNLTYLRIKEDLEIDLVLERESRRRH